MKVFVVGYPRMATSGIYRHLCLEYMDYCFFEPFNPHVMLNLDIHVHDRIGRPPMTYDRLPRTELEFIIDNSRWFHDWIRYDKPETPYLGDHDRVLDILFMFDNVVVKDVYAWPLIPHFVEYHIEGIKYIFPFRNLDHVYNSFLGWYQERHPFHRLPWLVSRLFRKIRVVTREPTRVKTRASEAIRLYKSLNPRNMMGVGVFYRGFGFKPPKLPVLLFGKHILRKMFMETARIYTEYLLESSWLLNNDELLYYSIDDDVEVIMDKKIAYVFFNNKLDMKAIDKIIEYWG